MTNQKRPRRQERIYAFKVLYGLCFKDWPVSLTELEEVFLQFPDKNQDRGKGFAWELVKGVWENQAELDEALNSFSDNWRVDRMGKVEVTLLRIALFELRYRDDIPPKVALNEAVELSKLFGDDKSRSFVNGILDAAAKASNKD